MMGDSIANIFGVDVSRIEFVKGLQENKMSSCIMIWMLGNMVISGLSNTGAFEIAYDGQMVFSKLETGRMPSVAEIMGGIDSIRNHMQ